MLEKVAWWFILLGALNWLGLGLFQTDVGYLLFGGMDTILSRILYVLVGLAGVYLLPQAFGVNMFAKKK